MEAGARGPSEPGLTRSVVLRREAVDDLASARDWYEQRQQGLGIDFVHMADEALERIGRSPLLFGVIDDEKVRVCRLVRFPYVVYYRVLSDAIEILAVLHAHRDARAWRARL